MLRRKPKRDHSVYMLMDPINAETFYIGLSKNPQRRFRSHLSKSAKGEHSNQDLALRIITLLRYKRPPAMIILYTKLTADEAAIIEKMVIRRYKIGHTLLNYTDGGELGNHRKTTKKRRQTSKKNYGILKFFALPFLSLAKSLRSFIW